MQQLTDRLRVLTNTKKVCMNEPLLGVVSLTLPLLVLLQINWPVVLRDRKYTPRLVAHCLEVRRSSRGAKKRQFDHVKRDDVLQWLDHLVRVLPAQFPLCCLMSLKLCLLQSLVSQ